MADNQKNIGVKLCYIVEHRNCDEENINAFEELLHKDDDVNFKNFLDDDNTPLHLAIKKQNVPWIRFLVKAGACPDVRNKRGISARDAAAALTKNPEVLMALNRFKTIDDKYSAFIDCTTVSIFKIPEVTNNVKILKMNCGTLQNAKLLLSLNTFLNEIERTKVFVLIFEIDGSFQDDSILESLNKSFRSPMIIQFYTVKTSFLYFNDSNGSFKKLMGKKRLNSDELKKQMSKIIKKQKCDLQLFHNLLNSKDKYFGRFKRNIMRTKIDMHKRIGNVTLADLVTTKGDLLAFKFLNLFGLEFSCGVNDKIVIEAIQRGSLEDLKLVLGFPFSKENNIHQSKLNRFLDGKILFIAVEYCKIEVVRFLLENNCNVNVVDESGVFVTDCALKNKSFDILHELIFSDSPFTQRFKKTYKKKSFKQYELNFQEIISSRDLFHENIQENQMVEIKKFIKTYPRVKHAYTMDNQCALTTALKAKRFEIYSFLRFEGFSEGIDDKYKLTLKELDLFERETIKKYNRKYFKCSDSNHLQNLVSRSHLGFGSGQENFEKIRKHFIALNKVLEIQPILKVVAYARKLQIIFDFNLDSVCDLDPTQISDRNIVRGRTNYESGCITIGAKQADEEVLGTLAHELTHLAVHILYGNLGLPYRKEDSEQKEKFTRIAQKTFDNRSESEIISNAFDYEDEHIHSELIARIPHVCAMYRDEDLKKIKKVFKKLFRYFENTVLKECEETFPVIESQQKIQNLNKQLGVFKKYKSFQWFSSKHESYVDDIFNNNANFIIQTNHPELFLASIIKSQNYSSMLCKSYIFLDVTQLNNDIDFQMIADVFDSEKEPKMFVVQNENPESKDIDPILMGIRDNSKIIFISPAIPHTSNDFGRKIELQYNWNDLCDKSKKKFMAESIDFQGNTVARAEIVSSSNFLAKLPIKEVLNLKNWAVDRNLINQNFYVERSFSRKVNKEDIPISADDVCDRMMHQKTIILGDDSGKGKTSAAIDLAAKLMNRKEFYWVAFIDLKKYTKFFVPDDEIKPNLDYEGFFARILCESNLKKNLLLQLFEYKRVICFFDGYDEISPLYSKFVLQLMKNVRNSENFLLVTTRRHLSKLLIEELGVEAIQLKPFTKSDQETFLVKFWSQNSLKTKDTLFSDAKLLLKKFKKSLGDKNHDFFGNPLSIRIFAEISIDKNLNEPSNVLLNRFELYEKFWRIKINLLFDKGPLAKKDIVEGFGKADVLGIHHKFAIETFFPDYCIASLNLSAMLQPFNTSYEMIRRLGLLNVCIEGNSITVDWLHQTFVEYFVAHYLLDSLLQDSSDSRLETLYLMFKNVLLSSEGSEVRKFLNDKLEKTKYCNEVMIGFEKIFRLISEKAYELKPLMILNILHEGHTAIFLLIIKPLTKVEIYKFLTNEREIGLLITACRSRPGTFAKWWPIICQLFNDISERSLLFHCSPNYDLISIVLSCGNIFDIKSIVAVLFKLFSIKDLKEILTGVKYTKSKQLLFHFALRSRNSEQISFFWEETVQTRFPNVEDQKDILLAKGKHNQRILYEGIANASIEGINFVLKTMKSLLGPKEIMACFQDDCGELSTGVSVCLQLLAEERSLGVFNTMWNFIETILNKKEKKKVLSTKLENILIGCIENNDVRVTKRIFEITEDLFNRKEFKNVLKQCVYKSQFLRKFRQRKVLLEFAQAYFINDDIKDFILKFISFPYLVSIEDTDELRIFLLLVNISKDYFLDNQILSLVGGPKFDDFLKLLKNSYEKASTDSFLKFSYTAEDDSNDESSLSVFLQAPDFFLNLVFSLGSRRLISETIEFMQSKLKKSQIYILLNNQDRLKCNTLLHSLLNSDKSVVNLVWPLYTEIFNVYEIKMFLLEYKGPLFDGLKDEISTAATFIFTAIADHSFLITALEFIMNNFTASEFQELVFDRNVNIIGLVAKYYSKKNMKKFFNFIFASFENAELKVLLHKKLNDGILSLAQENESIECFNLFWLKTVEIQSVQELAAINFYDIFIESDAVYDKNIESLEMFKKNMAKLSEAEKSFSGIVEQVNESLNIFSNL